VRGLHGGNGAGFAGGDFHQLPRTALRFAAQVKVIADEQEKRRLAGEILRAPHGVTVAERRSLLDELDVPSMHSDSGAVALGVAGANDDADFFNAGVERFLDDDGEGSLGLAVAVNERLQRKSALALAGSGDDSFANVHDENLVK